MDAYAYVACVTQVTKQSQRNNWAGREMNTRHVSLPSSNTFTNVFPPIGHMFARIAPQLHCFTNLKMANNRITESIPSAPNDPNVVSHIFFKDRLLENISDDDCQSYAVDGHNISDAF